MRHGKRRPSKTLVQGQWHTLAPWLVLEKDEHGNPKVIRLCQDHETLGEVWAKNGAEIHLMWTPSKWLRTVN